MTENDATRTARIFTRLDASEMGALSAPNPFSLDAHTDDEEAGHGFGSWDDELWREVYGSRTRSEVHASDHAANPHEFNHAHGG